MMDLASTPFPQEVTIANGAAVSSTVNLKGGRFQVVGLQMPSAWTAASLTFQVSHDNVTFSNLYFGSGEFTITAAQGAAASLAVSFDRDVFAGWPFVKIRSGVAATPVNQGAARTITVMTRAV